MMARMIRNIHVPAYAPALDGVHIFEYNGVFVAEKKSIDIGDDEECESVDAAALGVAEWPLCGEGDMAGDYVGRKVSCVKRGAGLGILVFS
jgi:hypothetical protein